MLQHLCAGIVFHPLIFFVNTDQFRQKSTVSNGEITADRNPIQLGSGLLAGQIYWWRV